MSLDEIIPYLSSILQEQDCALRKAKKLVDIISVAWVIACQMAVKIVELLLEERANSCVKPDRCPKCGAKLESKGLRNRRIVSLIGLIKWRRRAYGCTNKCGVGQIAPLDEELGLNPHQRVGFDVQRAACMLAVFVPFETASKLLHRLIGLKVSSGAIWEWVRQAGTKSMLRLQEELDALENGEIEPEDFKESSLSAIVGADGVMAPFRPEKGKPNGRTVWREVKVGMMGRVSRCIGPKGTVVRKLVRKRLVAVLGGIRDLKQRLVLEATKQCIHKASQVAWISDGARGLWNLYEDAFIKRSRGILDFYHAAQHLWEAARIWLDGRTNQAKEWFKNARHRLRHGQHNEVIQDVQNALSIPGLPNGAYKTLANLLQYLETHREHIDYEGFKELGLPIGSGMVESACKWLIQQRFKGVGMRWSEEGFNHLLHLRLDWVNGRFDDQLFSPQ